MSLTLERPPAPTAHEQTPSRVEIAPIAVSRSDEQPALDQALLHRVKQMAQQTGDSTRERTVLLGLILAGLEGVDDEDIAALLDVRPARLTKMVHGEEQVPQKFVARWTAVQQILRDLSGVIRVEGVPRWLRTEIPALNGRTPIELMRRGRFDRVVAVTSSYRNEDFS